MSTFLRRACRLGLVLLTTVVVLLGAAETKAQGITPTDEQKPQFEAAVKSARNAGYTDPQVVGIGGTASGDMLAVLATSAGKGVLLALEPPNAGTAPPPVVIEEGKTPADIGVHGIGFEAFLGGRDLVDVVVAHQPFQLESSHRFDRHHVVRRHAGKLDAVCEFDGSSVWSYAKGPRSVSQRRTVTIEKVERTGGLAFTVSTVDERTESGLGPTTTEREPQKVVRYELDGSGTCRVVGASASD